METKTENTLLLFTALPPDAPEILALFTLAFSDPIEPMFFVLFPREEDKSRAVERMWGEEDARWVKIVDSSTGKYTSPSSRSNQDTRFVRKGSVNEE
jgi:hypothetical protein